jgi:hypothetical protein
VDEEVKVLKKEIENLKLEILKWKQAWFVQRDIIGDLGYNTIPQSYKGNKG